jgi:hypothetical protein
MKTQNLSFKVNNKRDSKSYNDERKKTVDRLTRVAGAQFKLRKHKLLEESLESYSY